MSREDTDIDWHPYCLRCNTMDRMKKVDQNSYPDGKVYQFFECAHCRAKHTRIFDSVKGVRIK